jgi:TolB-like protein
MAIQQKSIAVLPFVNLSTDPENEYLSDGITEEIINALTKVDRLKVTARTSSFAFKGKDQDIREIARLLGVANVLEGSVRKAGKRIRITAQLIQASDGFHLWSQNFDRELADIFALQDEISLLIADQIRENFGHIEIKDQLVDSHTANIEAYQQFLKGRFYQLNWKLEDFYRAIDFYKLSIRLDPGYYKPYFGLVQCYGILASWSFMDKAEALKEATEYMDQGMAIEANSTESFFALATQSLWVYWQVGQALVHLRNALQVSSQNTEALESCAECYTAIGRFDEAISCINQALEYNPLSANHHYTKGNIYYLSGQYDLAIDWMNKATAIDPKWDLTWQVKACCAILMNDRYALDDIIDKHPTIDNKADFLLLFEIRNEGKEAQEADFIRDHTGYLPWEVYIFTWGILKKQWLPLKTG